MLISLLLILVILFAGITLLKKGRWPKRIGDTPHCASCNYILTGLDSGRCPECGDEITPGSILHGERKARTGFVLTGSFLILLALALGGLAMSDALPSIDWYQFRPTSWLISDLDTPQKMIAWTELQTRLTAGKVSAAQQDRLTERALREQVSPSPSNTPLTDPLMTYLGQRWSDHAMTDAQEQRFFAGCSNLTLTIRPAVGPKDDIPYLVSHNSRGPRAWAEELTDEQIEIDGHKLPNGGGSTSFENLGGAGSFGSTIQKQKIGRHHFVLTLRIRIGKSGQNYSNLNSAYFDQERKLSADFDVLATQPAIAQVITPDAAAISRCISTNDFRWWQSNQFRELEGTVDVHGAPVSVGFDVIARIDGKEYPFGTLALPAGKQCGFCISSDKLPGIPAKQIDIILRSSEAAARNTIDINQIWQGEIVIPNIAVQLPPASATPATAKSGG